MGAPASPRPQACANDEDDERLVQVVEQYDEYLADQQHAIELLKQVRRGLQVVHTDLPFWFRRYDGWMDRCRDSSSSPWPR
jgi:hypothetical protein